MLLKKRKSENIVGGNTTVFKYDKGGNLQFKKIYAYSAASGKTVNDLLNGTFGKTVHYGYGVSTNKDLLTSYNGSGTLEYDNYGNPKKWFKHGANNSSLGYTLQWGHVSNLIAITDNDAGKRYTYKYNDQGIRTVKVVNGVTHKYYLQGEQIIAEKIGNNLIKFYYDGTGVCGFNYNGTDYYYQKNIQGDILKIFNGNGTLYAEYSYDAWGKCTIKTNVSGIADINPFRYRGYYFDTETCLYYLNARYYDPEIGRFISADSISYLEPETINGLNIYSYCKNNPVVNVDPSGEFALTTFGVLAILGIVSVAIVLGGGAQLASNALAGETGSDLWRGVAGAALGAGANALALCLIPLTGGASLALSALIGATVQTGVDTLETVIRGEEISLGQTAMDFGINFATTFVGNWIGAKIIPTNSGWFKPQKFLSVFLKPYGQKILLQTAIGAGVSAMINFLRKFKWKDLFN